MMNRMKIWAYVAATFGGALLASGCLFGGKYWLPLAILQEDIFG